MYVRQNKFAQKWAIYCETHSSACIIAMYVCIYVRMISIILKPQCLKSRHKIKTSFLACIAHFIINLTYMCSMWKDLCTGVAGL